LVDADTRKFFENPYVGDRPHIIRFLAKMGELLKEDTFEEGSANSGPGTSPDARQMFPSMKNP
jgi:hypothetical protein